MKKLLFLAVMIVLSIQTAAAQDRPAAEEVRQVVDYYYNGQGRGVILAEHFLCTEVALEGDDKNDCRTKHALPAVAQGAEMLLWMNFLVPSGDEADILVLFARKGHVRSTAKIAVKGAIRYRTWKKVPTAKVGEWQVTVLQEMGEEDLELATFNYRVE